MSRDCVEVIWNILEAKWLDISEAGLIALLATIVALLIPVAILLISPQQDKFPLDRSIIFRKVFLYRGFIMWILPVAISYIFPKIRLLSLSATIYLSILGVIVLSKIFKWLSSKDDKFCAETFKQKERIEYLRSLKDGSEILDAWSVILNSNYDTINQHGLLDVFIDNSKQIKNGQDNWDKEQFWGLLRDNFSKIKDDDIGTYKKLIRIVLSYYLDRDIWFKKSKEKRKLSERPPEALRQIAQKLMTRAITSSTNSIEAYVYFNEVENYLEDKNNDQIKTFLGAYVDDLIDCFIKNDVDMREKWAGDFFKRIEITRKNKNAQGTVLESYKRSVLIRYVMKNSNPSNEISSRIDGITERIFTEIDPIIWFRMITFVMWPYAHDRDEVKDNENRIKNWCSRSRNYGIFGRMDCSVFSISENDKKTREKIIKKYMAADIERQEKATYELLAKSLGFEYADFSPYLKIVKGLKKCQIGDDHFKEKLKILENTLDQFNKYVLDLCKT